ncbi:MAG TPA: Ig-like domain-containing protein [Anaerolineales bacterium]|nr:Ig-like domain-containing protein [Anaerolineales bacterium]
MRFRRRPSRRPLWIVLGAVLLTAALWALVSSGRPNVAGVFPSPETFPVPAPAPLTITFDRPMNQAAVAAALVSRPDRTGTFAWDENVLTFTPDRPWPSGSTVTVTLTAEARAASGLRLPNPYTWSFRTAPTLLAYLWPAGDPEHTDSDLYALDPDGGEVTRLTESDFGVLDYSLHPDGLSILLSLSNTRAGADLAELDLLTREIVILLDCGPVLCSSPQADPSGNLIAYETVTSGEIYLLEADGDRRLVGPGRFPVWSPNGLLLGYDPAAEAYFVYDPETEVLEMFPNITGEPAGWAHDGSYFLAPAITALGATSFASHLTIYPLGGLGAAGAPVDVTLDPLADDYAPAVSPDGGLIAFTRRSLAPERWTPGRQLWVMAPDGSDARPLTAAGLYHHTALAWRPDGARIAFVRSNQADLNEPPEIWIINLEGGEAVRLVIGGFAPLWIP